MRGSGLRFCDFRQRLCEGQLELKKSPGQDQELTPAEGIENRRIEGLTPSCCFVLNMYAEELSFL
jgi:hypothetical protein